MTAHEAWALGYFYGRSQGRDEPMLAELEARVGPHTDANDAIFTAAKAGYDRGVSDFVEYDEEEEDDGKVLIAGVLYDKETGQEADPQ